MNCTIVLPCPLKLVPGIPGANRRGVSTEDGGGNDNAGLADLFGADFEIFDMDDTFDDIMYETALPSSSVASASGRGNGVSSKVGISFVNLPLVLDYCLRYTTPNDARMLLTPDLPLVCVSS